MWVFKYCCIGRLVCGNLSLNYPTKRRKMWCNVWGLILTCPFVYKRFFLGVQSVSELAAIIELKFLKPGKSFRTLSWVQMTSIHPLFFFRLSSKDKKIMFNFSLRLEHPRCGNCLNINYIVLLFFFSIFSNETKDPRVRMDEIFLFVIYSATNWLFPRNLTSFSSLKSH